MTGQKLRDCIVRASGEKLHAIGRTHTIKEQSWPGRYLGLDILSIYREARAFLKEPEMEHYLAS